MITPKRFWLLPLRFFDFEILKASCETGLFLLGIENSNCLCHIVKMAHKVARIAETDKIESLGNWISKYKRSAASGKAQPLSVKDLETMWSPRFATAEIDELVIPRRTLARRKSTATMLTPEEQDRAFRLAQIQSEADRVFGNPDKASRWLRSQNNRLSGQTPLSILKSAAGATLVTELLVQIDHGMFV